MDASAALGSFKYVCLSVLHLNLFSPFMNIVMMTYSAQSRHLETIAASIFHHTAGSSVHYSTIVLQNIVCSLTGQIHLS